MVREEADASLRRYCPLGPGNNTPPTARLYEDFGLLPAAPTVAEDATDLFNHLTGYARQDSYRQLLVAPESLRAGLVGRTAHQAERKLAGKPARIQFKCNAVIDEVVVDALYRASQAGGPIDLCV